VTFREYPGDLEIANLDNGFRIPRSTFHTQAFGQLADEQQVC
jgi:hypothetical protein